MARKTETTKKEISPAPEAETKVNTRPAAGVQDYNDQLLAACEGNESDFDTKDMTVPRVKLLQALSPELVKADPSYIKAARPGDILLADRTLLEGDTGFTFIPCAYRREALVFQPKAKGGNFVANLGNDYDAVLAKCSNGENGEKLTEEGNELVETATYFGLAMNEGVPQPCVLSLNKSQWKVAKKLNTLIQQYREKTADGKLVAPPIYWRAWQFTTDATSNEKGNWFLWSPRPLSNIVAMEDGHALLATAKLFRDEVMAGRKTANHEESEA
jgi:hypothetical protein